MGAFTSLILVLMAKVTGLFAVSDTKVTFLLVYSFTLSLITMAFALSTMFSKVRTAISVSGAASFLGGSMRMTVSFCVIMVEITNNLQLLPLIMLVLLISKAVGDVFNGGFYEEQARLRGIPLLESRPKQYMRNMIAKEACVNQKVAYFPRVVKVGDVVAMLQSNSHNGFPVIDHLQNGETEYLYIVDKFDGGGGIRVKQQYLYMVALT